MKLNKVNKLRLEQAVLRLDVLRTEQTGSRPKKS
jgi:hypothetical protein